MDRDLDLSCLEVGRDIVLDHATVGGDLRMSGKSYKYGAPRVVEHARFRTRCTKLDAQALHCEGDADLSGLVVAKGARGGGDVTARHMSVRGDLNLADLDDHRPLADIAGSVDLQGASASRLVLSGKNFSQERSGSLDLSDTEFQKITVRSANKLPATRTEMLKLHHSRVGRWEITSWDDGKMKEREEHNAIDFLKKTTPILGGAHHSLERHLREEGRFNEANEVLRETAMHAWNLSISDLFSSIGRDWREKKTFGSKLRYILNWRRVEWPVFKASWYWVFSVLSRFVGYGTNPWPSLIFILGLFLASTMVFYNAAHVDAAKTFRERMDLRTVQTAEIHPGDKVKCNAVCAGSDKCLQQCSSWSLERALLLTIGYSTPLGKLKEDDLWRPSLDAVYFASAMSLLNWILWPVFLATVTKYILRRL